MSFDGLTPIELNIGRLALERGWITSAQLEEAIRERRDNKVYTLAQILLKKRLLTVRQFREMEDGLRKAREVTEPVAPQVPGSRPRQIGIYKVLGEIGRGGMATVYRALAPDGGHVAVKLLASAQDATRVARFRREVSVLSRLRHPGVVTVLGAGEERGCPFLVMELMPGGTLEDRLAAGPMSEDEALAIMQQIADAMASAHAVGVVHRDMKPANVLFDAAGHPCIADFGLAKVSDPSQHLTSTGMGLGTPHYMAPEQVTGASKEASPATDVYAMGAVLYRLLTGRVPFDAETILALHYKVTKETQVPLRQLAPQVSPHVELLVDRCLEKDARMRYADGAEVAEAVAAVRAGRAPRSRPISRRLTRSVRRGRLWAALGVPAAAVVALLVLRPWAGAGPGLVGGGGDPGHGGSGPQTMLTLDEARTLVRSEDPDDTLLAQAQRLILVQDPGMPSRLAAETREALLAGRPAEALAGVRAWKRLTPEDSQIDPLMADAWLALGEKREATAPLDRYLALRPDDRRRAMQRWDLARHFGETDVPPVSLAEWHPANRTAQARKSMELGRWNQALDSLGQALELEPTAARKTMEAECLLQVQDRDRAATALNEALGLDRDYAPALAARARLRMSGPRSELAKEDLDRLRALAPAWVDLVLAQDALDREDIPQALQRSARALESALDEEGRREAERLQDLARTSWRQLLARVAIGEAGARPVAEALLDSHEARREVLEFVRNGSQGPALARRLVTLVPDLARRVAEQRPAAGSTPGPDWTEVRDRLAEWLRSVPR